MVTHHPGQAWVGSALLHRHLDHRAGVFLSQHHHGNAVRNRAALPERWREAEVLKIFVSGHFFGSCFISLQALKRLKIDRVFKFNKIFDRGRGGKLSHYHLGEPQSRKVRGFRILFRLMSLLSHLEQFKRARVASPDAGRQAGVGGVALLVGAFAEVREAVADNRLALVKHQV